MTCNTSAVAVCCANASRVSVNSRAFSIAMTACGAKFSTSTMCLSENGRGSCRKMRIAPSSASPLCSATRKPVRIPARVCAYATVPGAVARSSSRTIFSPLAKLPVEWKVDKSPPKGANKALYSGKGDNLDRAIVRKFTKPVDVDQLLSLMRVWLYQ